MTVVGAAPGSAGRARDDPHSQPGRAHARYRDAEHERPSFLEAPDARAADAGGDAVPHTQEGLTSPSARWRWAPWISSASPWRHRQRQRRRLSAADRRENPRRLCARDKIEPLDINRAVDADEVLPNLANSAVTKARSS